MGGYPEEVIQKVWEKGRAVSFADSADWRLDCHGAWIGRKYYRDTQSPFGWHIEHQVPGCDLLVSLRPGNIHRALGTHEACGPASGTEYPWLLHARIRVAVHEGE